MMVRGGRPYGALRTGWVHKMHSLNTLPLGEWRLPHNQRILLKAVAASELVLRSLWRRMDEKQDPFNNSVQCTTLPLTERLLQLK